MALRRSQLNGKKSIDELELKVPESELIIIDMEEVEMSEKMIKRGSHLRKRKLLVPILKSKKKQ